MWSCDQRLIILGFLCEKLSYPQFYKDLTRKIILIKMTYFERWSWFKVNDMALPVGMALHFASVSQKG